MCSLDKIQFQFPFHFDCRDNDGRVWGRQGVNCCDRGVRDSSSVFTSQLNIIDFREEINQPWNVTLCPWQLNLTAFVSLRRRPPTPHSPRVIFFFFFWCPAYQPSFPNKKRGACRETSTVHMTSSLWSRPCRRYRNHPQPRHCSRLIKLSLIHAACSKCKSLCTGSGRYSPQMSLILLRMSLISVVTPSGRLQHLTRCERTKLVLDTQVEKKCFCKSLAQYFDYFNTFFFFCLVCASRFRYGEDAVPSIQTYKRYT